jgi:hypothetical protein
LGVLCTQCWLCLWIVSDLCLVYPMLAVSLDCFRPVSCVPNIGWVSGLSQSQDTGLKQSRDTTNIGYTRHRSETIQRHNQHWVHKTRTQCWLCLWIVSVLCLVYPMLVVSLDCLRPVSCVPNVGCVSGLSQSCVLCTQCWLCLWIVSDLCLVYPMLAVSLDTRHRTETIQRHNQHWVHKTQV